MIELILQHGNLLDAKTDVIVNPANSQGSMGGGGALIKAFQAFQRYVI